MSATAMVSPLLIDLRAELQREVDREITTTLQVAVCASSRMTRKDIVATLGVTDLEARMALQRLEGVALRWKESA